MKLGQKSFISILNWDPGQEEKFSRKEPRGTYIRKILGQVQWKSQALVRQNSGWLCGQKAQLWGIQSRTYLPSIFCWPLDGVVVGFFVLFCFVFLFFLFFLQSGHYFVGWLWFAGAPLQALVTLDFPVPGSIIREGWKPAKIAACPFLWDLHPRRILTCSLPECICRRWLEAMVWKKKSGCVLVEHLCCW